MRSVLILVCLIGLLVPLSSAASAVRVIRQPSSGLCGFSDTENRCPSGDYACFSSSRTRCCNCDAIYCYGCSRSDTCSGSGSSTTCKSSFPIIAVILGPLIFVGIVVTIVIVVCCCACCAAVAQNQGLGSNSGVASTSTVVITTPGPDAMEMQPQPVYVDQPQVVYTQPQYGEQQVVYAQPQYTDPGQPVAYVQEGQQTNYY